MTIAEISSNCNLYGEVAIPGDKSISHRALLMCLVMSGKTTLTNLNMGQDVLNTLNFIELLGVQSKRYSKGILELDFDGCIKNGNYEVWCGNSGTLARLGIGLVSGLKIDLVCFDGDESLRKRPMDRIVDPLELMGASLQSENNNKTLPVKVTSSSLKGIKYRTKTPSAQVKSAILLAGLNADGNTTISENKLTRRHTEELFSLCGIEYDTHYKPNDYSTTINGGQKASGFDIKIPCDPSQAAFFIAGALILPNSKVTLNNVYLGQERVGFLNLLQRMNATIKVSVKSEYPFLVGTIQAESSNLTAIDILEDEVADLVDEIPILAVCAASAQGTSRFNGLKELRVKESDRIATVTEMLRDFGVSVEVEADDMVITGHPDLLKSNVTTNSYKDHRIAMAASIMAMREHSQRNSVTKILNFECVDTSYLNYLKDLNSLKV